MNLIIKSIMLTVVFLAITTSNVEAKRGSKKEKEENTTSTDQAQPSDDLDSEDEDTYEDDYEDSGLSLAMQGRVDMMNLTNAPGAFGGFFPGNDFNFDTRFEQLFVPVVTIGVRLLDEALFAGLGLGFGGIDDGPEMFSMSPLVSYELLGSEFADLYVLGWFNISYLNFEELVGPNVDGDIVMGGLNFGAGLRGKINRSLSIGTEWGWGFVAHDAEQISDLIHGVWGNIVIEASLPL